MKSIQILEQEIQDLKKENQSLRESLYEMTTRYEENEKLFLPWIGNLGHWYWYVPQNIVHFNDAKINAIGYTKNDIDGDVSYQFFTDKLHKDDYDYVMENMSQHLSRKTPAYEVSYRIQHKNGQYKWYYDRGIVTKRDLKGAPLIVAGIVFDITEQKEMEKHLHDLNEQLQQYALNDALTKIKNRRAMVELLEKEIEATNNNVPTFSIIFIDIDDFKNINDQYGHIIGDTILKEVASLIKQMIRSQDQVARWGGDEFLILLPRTSLNDANYFAQTIKKNIEKAIFPKKITVSISAGISVYKKSTDTIQTVINRADSEMYHSKKY